MHAYPPALVELRARVDRQLRDRRERLRDPLEVEVSPGVIRRCHDETAAAILRRTVEERNHDHDRRAALIRATEILGDTSS